MKKLRILKEILCYTHTDMLLYSYIIFIFLDAFFIMLAEPGINSYGDAIWYCYEVLSTIGFGEMTSVTIFGRLCSILLTVYSIVIIAVITGVITNFYIQIIELKNKETIAHFMDKLEQLPEFSKEELKKLSEDVKRFRDNV